MLGRNAEILETISVIIRISPKSDNWTSTGNGNWLAPSPVYSRAKRSCKRQIASPKLKPMIEPIVEVNIPVRVNIHLILLDCAPKDMSVFIFFLFSMINITRLLERLNAAKMSIKVMMRYTIIFSLLIKNVRSGYCSSLLRSLYFVPSMGESARLSVVWLILLSAFRAIAETTPWGTLNISCKTSISM